MHFSAYLARARTRNIRLHRDAFSRLTEIDSLAQSGEAARAHSTSANRLPSAESQLAVTSRPLDQGRFGSCFFPGGCQSLQIFRDSGKFAIKSYGIAAWLVCGWLLQLCR